MQRVRQGERRGYAGRREALRKRKKISPQPARPATTPQVQPYFVRVRNTPDQRAVWSAYIKGLLAATGLTGPKLAQRLGINAATVWRWETGKQKPEDPAIPQAIAKLFQLDLDEVLAAAGLRPEAPLPPPPQPTQLDEETEMILSADIDEDTRRAALEQLHRMRLRDKQRRMEDIREFFLRRGGSR